MSRKRAVDGTTGEDTSAVPNAHNRVISASCFRVLSLQLETQNEVDVLKPILEELEVLRLSCVLGALPTVNPKDFEFEMLDAKDFDDEFARFLRSDVFGNGSEGPSNVATGPLVRVIGLFGKQAQLKNQLQRLCGWDAAMDSKLRACALGLYAVVLPEVKEEDKVAVKTVVVFAWLSDEYFHADRLRETPAYLLRLLTSLTNDVTCCLSTLDKQLFEDFALKEDSIGDGGDEEWKSYSVAFRVEQQEDAKDDVQSALVSVLCLPSELKNATNVDVAKGSFPALTAVIKGRPPKTSKRIKTTFRSVATFCAFITRSLESFDVRFSSANGWRGEIKEELLKRFNQWPDKKIAAIQAKFIRSKSSLEAQTRASRIPQIDACHEQLERVREEVFRVDELLHPEQLTASIAMIKTCLHNLRSNPASPGVAEQNGRILKLPLRLPKMIPHFLDLFKRGQEEKLRHELQHAPFTECKLTAANYETSKQLFKKMTSWLFSERNEIQTMASFRERVRPALERMKQIWWAEVERTLGAWSHTILQKRIDANIVELEHTMGAECSTAIDDAFRDLVIALSASEQHGVCRQIGSPNPAPSPVSARGQSESTALTCWISEDELAPPCVQLKVWQLHNVGASDLRLCALGAVDLGDDEKLLGAFTIQSRSILMVSSDFGKTIVHRVEFYTDSDVSARGPQNRRVRKLGRVASGCDYHGIDRLLVLWEESGMVGIYRLDETFSCMETIRTLDLALKTSLEMPLASAVVSDGIVYMVDHTGAMQTLNSRNQQTSRKKLIASAPTDSARSTTFGLVRVLDGMVLGWLDDGQSHASGRVAMRFVATDDLRELPQSVAARIPLTGRGGVAYGVVDQSLILVDVSRGKMYDVELKTTLKSESFRIRSTREAQSKHQRHASGVRAEDSSSSHPSVLSQQHWLWTFYHLYEKFPVCGELFRAVATRVTPPLAVSFACDVEDGGGGDALVVDGCRKLLNTVMHKLQMLNKPLYGLDLASCPHESVSSTRGTPRLATTLVRELVMFVPIQICRAERNTLTLMVDGMRENDTVNADQPESGALHSADIAMKLRFGLLSPLLLSWRKQCIVVTSMGKQSTGKSYFLNHLTGTSFAIAGARCTDGAWMSVRVLPRDVLLVVIDFEGLGSFERTEQEDVFLSVLNASVSMLTIFRMEMRLDKEIDELFSKFQKGARLITRDSQLFRGKLYMSVKDVNPNDQRGVVDEFVTKVQRLLGANKEQNFLSEMYAGQLDINCSPPLGTIGYYRSLSHVQKYIERQLCGNPKAGFASGKVFLDSIRLLLAKLSILDWTSLDESALRFKTAEAMKKLPGLLRFGRLGDGLSKNATREQIVDATTGTPMTVSVDEVCAANPGMSTKWRQLAATIAMERIEDEAIDLGLSVAIADTMKKTQAATTAIRTLFHQYLELIVHATSGQAASKSLQHDFDTFLSFMVSRRCLRVRKWSRMVFGDRVPEAWTTTEQHATSALQTMLVRCLDACSTCQLGCMKASTHAVSGDVEHDCGTNHACSATCAYCSAAGTGDDTPQCAKPAGHEGLCECAFGDHTCRELCRLAHAGNCGKTCTKKSGHSASEDHRCAVGLHKCGQPCGAYGCARFCVLDVELLHTMHKCEVDRCLAACVVEGCNRSCSSTDHFHGQDDESSIACDAQSSSSCESSFEAMEDTATHICDQPHVCPELCEQDGICHVDVILKQSSKTFVGARGSFQYTFQEMNGSRKKCRRKMEPGEMAHAGRHSCCDETTAAATDNGEDRHEIETENEIATEVEARMSTQVRHYCDVRCPSCSYYCQRECGHSGLHKTTHGNMRNTMFLSDDHEIDLVDRKYTAGERGTAEMCNLYCSKMGRGHVHFLDCEKQEDQASMDTCVYTGSREDMRRHCTRQLEPTPQCEQDELLHGRFWDTLGWEDPCASVQERDEFDKCAYKCDAPDHDDDATENDRPSYCVLSAWHVPAQKPEDGSGFDGFSYVGGHKFECSHVTQENKMHHVFVLDASGSMQGPPWQKLNGAFREYIHNRINDGADQDLVSVVTFDHKASIVWEAQSITLMTQVEAPYRGGGTSFAAGLRAANEVLSRVAFDAYKPVLVFFSDGHPGDALPGEQLACHIAQSYAKYGLEAFAVGFGTINLSVLQRVAEKLGGAYCHVLTGDELKPTFQSISASLGTRAGLALTKPLHEMVCVICQKELASEATAELEPCKHELHTRCLRRLVENAAATADRGDGAAPAAPECPTCRGEIQI